MYPNFSDRTQTGLTTQLPSIRLPVERDVKYGTRYQVTVLIHMHKPHLSGIRRITHFVMRRGILVRFRFIHFIATYLETLISFWRFYSSYRHACIA